jgi:hypothetical protein
MRDQRDLSQDAVLHAQIATANRLIAEQSVAFARAHSAIERAIESLREPDARGRVFVDVVGKINDEEARNSSDDCGLCSARVADHGAQFLAPT